MINLDTCKNVVTIFAHPDDETLAAGGTISKLTELGANCTVIIPATGVTARGNKMTDEQVKMALAELRHDCNIALAHLGVGTENIILGEFQDNEMDGYTLLSVIQWLEEQVKSIEPDLILTHHRECTNIDHQICHEAVTVLSRPGEGWRIPVLCGEVPSSTGYRRPTAFEPNLYVGLTEAQVDNKIKSMQSFGGEARPDPHPRSPEVLKSLAKVRGSESGFLWAEAFMQLRAFA